MTMEAGKLEGEGKQVNPERYSMKAKEQSLCLMFLFSKTIIEGKKASSKPPNESASYFFNENLKSCFERLGFDVKCYPDIMERDEIRSAAQKGVMLYSLLFGP